MEVAVSIQVSFSYYRINVIEAVATISYHSQEFTQKSNV